MNPTREGISKKITFELRQKGGRVVGLAQILELSTLGRSKTRNKEVGTSRVQGRGKKPQWPWDFVQMPSKDKVVPDYPILNCNH